MNNSISDKILKSSIVSVSSTSPMALIKTALSIQKRVASRTLFLSHKDEWLIQDLIKNREEYQAIAKENMRFMFLKDRWITLEKKYGKIFFMNEVNKIMNEENVENIFFNQMDIFFHGCSTKDIEKILPDIIDTARVHHKRIIFLFNNKSDLGAIIANILSKESDITIKALESEEEQPKIELMKYRKDGVSIAIYSQNKEMLLLHKFIFHNESNITINHITNITQDARLIMSQNDIIIFNLTNPTLEARLLNYIKNENIIISFFHISDKIVIRKRDKALQLKKVLEKHFDVLEYICMLEDALGNNFYTQRLRNTKISSQKQICRNLDELTLLINTYLKEQICFCIIAVQLQQEQQIDKEMISGNIRDGDGVFFDNSSNIILFLMIDMMCEHGSLLIDKRLQGHNYKIDYISKLDISESRKLANSDSSLFSSIIQDNKDA